jgi:hypothetical protein
MPRFHPVRQVALLALDLQALAYGGETATITSALVGQRRGRGSGPDARPDGDSNRQGSDSARNDFHSHAHTVADTQPGSYGHADSCTVVYADSDSNSIFKRRAMRY